MAIRMVEKNTNDNLVALPSRIRSPSQPQPRSPFMTALLRRQSKNDHTRCNFKEHRRIVVLGSAKVGKSAIIRQFLYDQFCERYTRTIEDLYIAEYNLPNGASLTLEILDTTGSYQFPAMRALSISNGGVFILTYSVDDEDSWNEINELRRQVNILCSIFVFLKINNCLIISFYLNADYLCSWSGCTDCYSRQQIGFETIGIQS